MKPSRTELLAEMREHRANVDLIDGACIRGGRDMTPTERASYDASTGRMELIDAEVGRGRAIDAGAAITRGFVGAPVEFGRTSAARTNEPVIRASLERSVGTYAFEQGRAALGSVGNERFREYAGELGRDVAHGVSGDGTSPVTIEGDLVKFVDANRYLVNASRRLPMPDNHAETFKRPRLTQSTQVGNQAAQGNVLASRRLQTTGDLITKQTEGGVLALSEQEIDWTDPAMLGLAIVDLSEQYGIDTDTALCVALEAQFDQSTAVVVSLTPTADAIVKAVAAAALVVYKASKRRPDILFASVAQWAALAAITDLDGRPLFPIAGNFNAAGANAGGVATFSGMDVMGLQVVVDPNFQDTTWGVAASSLIEFYEQDKGLLSVNVPSTLEVQYAYRGYIGTNVYAQGVCGFEAS